MKLTLGRSPPSDGKAAYHFPVSESVTLHAQTLDALYRNIFEWRLRNNVPLADPERDVSTYYCRRWPAFCHKEPHDVDPSQPRISTESMLNRVSRWVAMMIHRMPRGGFDLVPNSDAEKRADTCIGCPLQDPKWRGGCGGCSASTLALIQQVKKMRTTKRDGSLGACRIMGWSNLASVHLPTDVLEVTAEQQQDLPDHCWRKNAP